MAANRYEPFPVLDVSDWAVAELEPGGTDEKVWLRVPGGDTKALFKPNRSRAGLEQGEDWPEKLASEVATLLGLPAAGIDLAERNGGRGCLSYDIVPRYYELQPGAVLLDELLDFQHDPRDRAARGHTLTNIRQVLSGYGPPPGFSGPAELDAFAVFAGYLLLDALISNRDRHWRELGDAAWPVHGGSVPGSVLRPRQRARLQPARRASRPALPRPQHDGGVLAQGHRLQVRRIREGDAGRARARGPGHGW